MAINRTYKGNRFIFGFNDSDMRHNFLPLSVSNDKISYTCSNPKFNKAFIINHVNGNHTVNIDWERFIMTQAVEVFDLYIKYDGNIRIRQSIRIDYPLSDVRFNIQLNKKSGTWGVQPDCELRITPTHPASESWKYGNKLVRVLFMQGTENYFFPSDNKSDISFRAKDGITIPLKFIFKKSPLNSKEKFNVAFTIDGVSKYESFYFEPAPINQSSYDINIERLVKDFEYGTHNKPLFVLEVNANNDYVNPAKISTITFSNSAPFSYRVDKGKHLIYMDVSTLRWIDIDKKYNVQITLDNSLRFDKEIYICTKDCFKSNGILLKPGHGPSLRLLPDNAVEIYQNEKCELGLDIENILSSPITVTKISSNDDTYNYNGGAFTIKGGAKKTMPISVKGIGNKTITFRLYTKETDVVKVSLNVKTKKKEDVKIHPEFILRENYKLIVKEGYDCDEICGKIVIDTNNQTSQNTPFVKGDFRLHSDDFYIESSNITNDSIYIFNIYIKKGAFSNIESIPIENGCYLLSWEYHNQKGKVLIPFLKSARYKLKFPKVVDVSFPHPDENKQIKLCEIDVSEPTYLQSVLDDEQEISVSSPFFMLYNNEAVQQIALTQPTRIALYVDIDKVDQVCKDALNIDDTIKLNAEITRKSKRRGESTKSGEILIHPIKEDPKLKIYFVSNDDVEIALSLKKRKQTDIQLFEQSEDVIAVSLGSICIRNLSKIPCFGKAVRFCIKSIKANVGISNLLNDDTDKYIGYNYEIPNGGEDFLIPIFINYQSWKNLSHNEHLLLSVEIGEDISEEVPLHFEILLTITHLFVDDVYALDLGTTGIVVAKERDGEQEIVELEDDGDDPIEEDSKIISSQTMLVAEQGDNNGYICLSPSGHEYYGRTKKKRFRLVPSKFIIGQERIPFLQEFYTNSELSKNVELFGLDNYVDLSTTDDSKSNEDKISSLIGALYKGIFERCSNETNSIKKLVITYPNTYTIDNLDSIKTVLQEKLHLNSNGQVTFVPESDAVAAYYFDQKIMNDGGFLDENGNPKEEENVVIYDMGAGTLDLSLISFKRTPDDSITASIVSKIGIPLAGNYLNYIIYKTLLDKGIVKKKEEFDDNTIKDLTEGIKHKYNQENEPILSKRPIPDWYSKEQDNLNIEKDATYESIFSKELIPFFDCCSKTILKLLIPSETTIDTIVFSGRASQFASLREKVKEALNEQQGRPVKEDKLLPTGNCGDYLKTCVAIGALKYQNFFNGNGQFKIENKNLYSKIAVVYWGKKETGGYGVCVKFLVDPLSENWEDAELVNGTWCKEFGASENISGHIIGKYLYYIQTHLDEKQIQDLFKKVYQKDPSRNDDLNWAFVNILYKKRITDSKPFSVSLRISRDNKIIDRRIGCLVLNDKKLLENVEDNILYKRSMWPFITKLKD